LEELEALGLPGSFQAASPEQQARVLMEPVGNNARYLLLHLYCGVYKNRALRHQAALSNPGQGSAVWERTP
jgi:hypothetical protein